MPLQGQQFSLWRFYSESSPNPAPCISINRSMVGENPSAATRILQERALPLVITRWFWSLASAEITCFPRALAIMRIAGGPEAQPFRATSWVGWVAETRETGKRQEPGHRLAPDPSEKSPVTIPSERAITRVLGSSVSICDCSELLRLRPAAPGFPPSSARRRTPPRRRWSPG
jgi:hypothetical protein